MEAIFVATGHADDEAAQAFYDALHEPEGNFVLIDTGHCVGVDGFASRVSLLFVENEDVAERWGADNKAVKAAMTDSVGPEFQFLVEVVPVTVHGVSISSEPLFTLLGLVHHLRDVSVLDELFGSALCNTAEHAPMTCSRYHTTSADASLMNVARIILGIADNGTFKGLFGRNN